MTFLKNFSFAILVLVSIVAAFALLVAAVAILVVKVHPLAAAGAGLVGVAAMIAAAETWG